MDNRTPEEIRAENHQLRNDVNKLVLTTERLATLLADLAPQVRDEAVLARLTSMVASALRITKASVADAKGGWVDVNLPWEYRDEQGRSEYLKAAASVREQTAAEEVAVFGSPRLLFDTAETLDRGRKASEVAARSELLSAGWGNYTESWLEEVRRTHSSDPEVIELAEFRCDSQRRHEWATKRFDAEYAALAAQHAALDALEKSKQFSTHPMCRPGVQVEIVDSDGTKALYLIGDILKDGCDGGEWNAFRPDTTTVLRYRVLVDFT